MDTRAVLLRGVNVGGNNPVPKARFGEVLRGIGAEDITVYLNSGNAVGRFPDTLTTTDISGALEEAFGWSIPTLVLPGQQIAEISAAIPEHWTNDRPQPDKSGQKSDVVYLFDDVDEPGILDRLGYRPEVETMQYVPGAVLANVTRAQQHLSSLQRVVGTALYRRMTVRNVNTARALAALAANLST